jgi:AcrR family transcriptional regulator
VTKATQAPAPPAQLRRDAERNRQRLLDSARALFAERGFDVTLDEIARHAGVGVGTAYRRFANKDELIAALFEERAAEVVALAEECVAIPDAWTGVVHWLYGITELHACDLGLKSLMTTTRHGRQPVERMRERLMTLLTPMFRRAQADGRLRDDLEPSDMPLLVFMVSSLADYSRDVAPDLWRRHLAIVIDGLRAQRRATTELPEPPLAIDDLDRVMESWR